MFRPVSPTAERDGNRMRIYASPRFIRSAGVWRAMSEVFDVRFDPASHAFTFRFDGKSVVVRAKLASLDAVTAATKRVVADWRRFGPILDVGKLDSVGFSFEVGPGVTRVENGYLFGVYDGVRVGVFFDDWARMFGNRLALDLKAQRAAMDLREMSGEVDFDPATLDASQSGYMLSTDYSSWTSCLAGPPASPETNSALCFAYGLRTGNTRQCYRSFIRFAGVPPARTASLYLHPNAGQGNKEARVYSLSADYGTLATGDWGAAGTSEKLISDPTLNEDYKVELDVSNITRPAYCVKLRDETSDVGESEPADGVTEGIRFDGPTGDDPPYMELTLAGGGGSSPVPDTHDTFL